MLWDVFRGLLLGGEGRKDRVLSSFEDLILLCCDFFFIELESIYCVLGIYRV